MSEGRTTGRRNAVDPSADPPHGGPKIPGTDGKNLQEQLQELEETLSLAGEHLQLLWGNVRELVSIEALLIFVKTRKAAKKAALAALIVAHLWVVSLVAWVALNYTIATALYEMTETRVAGALAVCVIHLIVLGVMVATLRRLDKI